MGLNLDNTTGTLKLGSEEVMLEAISGNDNVAGLASNLTDYSIYFDNIPSRNGVGVETPQGVNISKGATLAMHWETDTATRTFTSTTVWTNGRTFSNFAKTAGSKIMLYWKVASRNDLSTTWGGSGINVLYSVDGGTVWASFAASTYAGGCMVSSAASIASQNGNQLMDIAAITNATQIRIKFQHRPYSAGTLTVNGSHSITGGAANFGFSHIMIQEISTV